MFKKTLMFLFLISVLSATVSAQGTTETRIVGTLNFPLEDHNFTCGQPIEVEAMLYKLNDSNVHELLNV